MKIVVTGANGFLGKNLCVFLNEVGKYDVVEITRDTSQARLLSSLAEADFVYHLAGVNRPDKLDEFQAGNAQLTRSIVDSLIENGRQTPLVLSSSVQAVLDNPYGRSKLEAEEAVRYYSKVTGSRHYIYRFPNLFGKWSRPNYNSFVATFCYNTLNDIDIVVNDPSKEVVLAYVDDVCESLIQLLDNKSDYGLQNNFKEYQTTVGEVAEIITLFKKGREKLVSERVGTGLIRALYSTYLSFSTPNQFTYDVPVHTDERGIFCEILKTRDSGQFSFFTAYPGVTRGGHYHHTKNEKFLVIRGSALFRFKNLLSGEVHELTISGKNTKIVETIPGWVHEISNIGDDELFVMLWANEIFDKNKPDTIARSL
tara:strand:+ start:732 stop:1835 length:1104 start_codon:yes stop_codon:yes gene_type:complete